MPLFLSCVPCSCSCDQLNLTEQSIERIASCASSPCQPPEAIMGRILFSGAFNPQFHFHPPPSKPPYENFTVQIFKKVQRSLILHMLEFLGCVSDAYQVESMR
ncbi:hypothetical protein JOM56_015735 [Amanita muscaria]